MISGSAEKDVVRNLTESRFFFSIHVLTETGSRGTYPVPGSSRMSSERCKKCPIHYFTGRRCELMCRSMEEATRDPAGGMPHDIW